MADVEEEECKLPLFRTMKIRGTRMCIVVRNPKSLISIIDKKRLQKAVTMNPAYEKIAKEKEYKSSSTTKKRASNSI